MNRFEIALHAAQGPDQVPLSALAKNFHEAVMRVEAEGLDPHQDPAVVVLGSFIAFHVHSDINTAAGYRDLLDMCARQASITPELQ